MLGVEPEPESQVRRLAESDRMAMAATEAMTQARLLRRETEELLHQALRESAALTSTIAEVIATETGIDVAALERDHRLAVRARLHGILLAMAELAQARPDDVVVDRTRAAVSHLVGEAMRELGAEPTTGRSAAA